MSGIIMLCLDEASTRNPQLVGLDGENLTAQPWLRLYCCGEDARVGAAREDVNEAWVVCCDDVEPINLAAALKSDKPQLYVCLVDAQPCGSLRSRAHTAGIDQVLDISGFVQRYAQEKRAGAELCLPVVQQDSLPVQEGAVQEDSAQQVMMQEAVAQEVAAQEVAVQEVAVQEVAVQEATVLQQHASANAQVSAQIVPPETAANTRGFMLTVVSGSGGAGKSAVSALSALIAEQAGHRTVLIDADLQFGDVANMVGVGKPLGIDQALAQPSKLHQLVMNRDQMAVLAAPAHLETAEQVVGQLPALLDKLLIEFDVLVVNTGASWGEQHAALLERSSAAIFLIDQRVSSLRACQHALDLCARCGIASGPFQFALNRCTKNAPLSSADVSCALQGAPVYELRDGGPAVEDYLSGGAASELLQQRNEFIRSLVHMLRKVLPESLNSVQAPALDIPHHRAPRRKVRSVSRKRGW